MQVFKTFFKILKKQKTTIIIYLVIFLVIEAIMSIYGSTQTEKNFTQSEYSISVFDYDNSNASKNFVSYLDKSNKIVDLKDDSEDLRDALFVREIQCVIYIPDGFEDALAEGNAEGFLKITTIPGTVYSETIISQFDQYIRTVSTYIAADFSMTDSLNKAESVLSEEVQVSLLDNTNNGLKTNLYYFYLYIPYLLICVSIIGIGSCLIVFNRKEQIDRMNCSSCTLINRNVGLLSASITAEIVIALLFIILSVVMRGSEVFSVSGALFILNVFCFMWVALSIAYLAGILAKSEDVLNMIGNVVGLGFSFLGGIFVPIEIFGKGLKTAAHFIPTYWYVSAADIIESGTYKNGSGDLYICFIVQICFAIAITFIALAFSKAKRDH